VASPGDKLPEGTQLALPLEVPDAPQLRPLDAWQSMVADYATTGLTLAAHPMALARPLLGERLVSSCDLFDLPHDARVRIGGLVVARQRPGTANGIVFMLLEDEFGTINLVVTPQVYERHRLTVRSEPLVIAEGKLEKLPLAGGAINVFVTSIHPIEVPGEAADVVPLPGREQRAPEAEPATTPPLVAAAGGTAVVPADFRGVAPPVQSFASGRRR
jgi:error-prone DNA polymerase